jgi:hypothetical protein
VTVTCENCGFTESTLFGSGMVGVEVVPCVCRRCEDIVQIERVWQADGASESHLQSVEEHFEVEIARLTVGA